MSLSITEAFKSSGDFHSTSNSAIYPADFYSRSIQGTCCWFNWTITIRLFGLVSVIFTPSVLPSISLTAFRTSSVVVKQSRCVYSNVSFGSRVVILTFSASIFFNALLRLVLSLVLNPSFYLYARSSGLALACSSRSTSA